VIAEEKRGSVFLRIGLEFVNLFRKGAFESIFPDPLYLVPCVAHLGNVMRRMTRRYANGAAASFPAFFQINDHGPALGGSASRRESKGSSPQATGSDGRLNEFSSADTIH
jgi:hypothetical protein